LIDGTGHDPVINADIFIQGDTIGAIGRDLTINGVQVLNMEGKTIMPALSYTRVKKRPLYFFL
jgi:dihydroorotase-like cyclic amidohydrolase